MTPTAWGHDPIVLTRARTEDPEDSSPSSSASRGQTPALVAAAVAPGGADGSSSVPSSSAAASRAAAAAAAAAARTLAGSSESVLGRAGSVSLTPTPASVAAEASVDAEEGAGAGRLWRDSSWLRFFLRRCGSPPTPPLELAAPADAPMPFLDPFNCREK